jgi:hypothetical protein
VAGDAWHTANAGLPTNPVNLAIDSLTPSTLYAGTEGGGVFSIQQVAEKVVGTGTAAGCTDAALNAALDGAGLVTFNCGGPATIDISTTKTSATDTIIDGSGMITINGGNSVGVFRVSPGVNFTVKNLTIANGLAHPGGGGIYNDGGVLTVTNSTFTGNRAVFGGAIFNGGLRLRATISNSISGALPATAAPLVTAAILRSPTAATTSTMVQAAASARRMVR